MATLSLIGIGTALTLALKQMANRAGIQLHPMTYLIVFCLVIFIGYLISTRWHPNSKKH